MSLSALLDSLWGELDEPLELDDEDDFFFFFFEFLPALPALFFLLFLVFFFFLSLDSFFGSSSSRSAAAKRDEVTSSSSVSSASWSQTKYWRVSWAPAFFMGPFYKVTKTNSESLFITYPNFSKVRGHCGSLFDIYFKTVS